MEFNPTSMRAQPDPTSVTRFSMVVCGTRKFPVTTDCWAARACFSSHCQWLESLFVSFAAGVPALLYRAQGPIKQGGYAKCFVAERLSSMCSMCLECEQGSWPVI